MRLIRYVTRPETTEENQRLVEAVFAALREAPLDGIRYMTLKGPEGAFMHLFQAETEEAGARFRALPAFQAFQAQVSARCLEKPLPSEWSIVGSHGFLATP